MAQLWGGRFTKETDKLVYNFNASITFDQKFYEEDIDGSIAHVTMLAAVGILTEQERDDIIRTLKEIKAEVDSESESITMVKKYNSYPCYGVVDNKSYLELTDDIAYRLGNNEWRIPSIFDFIELLDVDLCEMMTDRENEGLWIKSKKNGNKVFFGLGRYWSNTLYEKDPTNAYIFCITCSNMYLVNLHRKEPYLFYAQINATYRSNDLKIRPVLIKN